MHVLAAVILREKKRPAWLREPKQAAAEGREGAGSDIRGQASADTERHTVIVVTEGTWVDGPACAS
jgi:hypothetical protein